MWLSLIVYRHPIIPCTSGTTTTKISWPRYLGSDTLIGKCIHVHVVNPQNHCHLIWLTENFWTEFACSFRFNFKSLRLACLAQQTPMASDTKLTEIQKILDPFLDPSSTTCSFDPLSPKPSPSSVASPDPPSFDQFSPPYPPPEETQGHQQKKQRMIESRPPPPSYEETMALRRRNQESQKLQELLNTSDELNDGFQQRSYSFNDLLQEAPDSEFPLNQGRWTSDGVLASSTWQTDTSVQQFDELSHGSSISYETSVWQQMPEDTCSSDGMCQIQSPGSYQHQQEQLPTSPDVRDPFTAPLPWRQEASSLPQQPSSSTFTDLPADLAELISDNGFGASLGEVPRSNSVPADTIPICPTPITTTFWIPAGELFSF